MCYAVFPDLMELPFIFIDGNRTYLSSTREDDLISIQRGFPFGNSNQTTVHVRNDNCIGYLLAT